MKEFEEISLKDISQGITPDGDMSLEQLTAITRNISGYDITDLYKYSKFKNVCRRGLKDDKSELDEFMWEDFTTYIENSRMMVYDTMIENGVNECESYFLSLKFLWSALRKFRGKFFTGVNSRLEYDKMPLKIAINHLMHVRLKNIMATDSYKYSAKAANGSLGQFRKEAAWEVSRYLAEETGTIFHAKITL